MNLAWLAAVLEPRDIAAHPNFPDDDYDSGGPPRLAAIVLGDRWRLHRAAQFAGEPSDDRVVLAQRCLRPETVAVSVAELARHLTGPRPDDLAQAAALALIACSAAAELDDYRTCLQVLDAQLRWIPKLRTPDDALLYAALLQQKALRLRDAGQSYVPTASLAAAAVSQLVVDRCSPFPTGPGVSWSSSTTVEHILGNLVAAIDSLIPIDTPQTVKPVGFPTWQDQVRGDAPTITVRTAIDNARTYREYVGTVFQDQFASRTRSVGESMRPDLFYSLLAFELLGHRAVYAARKELALLRLVQDGGDQAEMADALRLLRHAAAKNELDLALRRLRAGGPLSVLSRDARQVLRTRTAPELLRRVELQVLGAAAELLAPPEARVALDAIRATLAAGGPRDLPGWSELPVLRKEVAWVAAAALGNACGAASEVANLLLDEAEKHRQEDELVDRGLRRALAEVEWGDVQPDVREAWTTFLRTRGADLSGTAEVLSIQIGSQAFAPVPLSAMDSLARRLNAALGGEPLDPALGREGIPMVREALKKIRSEAAKGTYSISGISPADVAAGLILMAGAQELWPELTDFLLDSHVHREDRTPAFERLARADLSLPTDVIARFHARAQELLLATSSSRLFEPSLVPYPSALRFLGAHRLLDEADTYDAVATLSGAVSTAARYEAAVTVAVLAATSPRSHLLALVLPLSRDHDVDVRANAGRALAALAQPEEPLGAVAVRRLAELLAEDGLLAPLLVLRALADAPGGLPALVRRQVEELAAQHPSRSVRTEASRLLAPQHSGEENGP